MRQATEAHQHLAAIVASSEDAIISETLEGTVLSWNQGAQRLYGYTAEEMIGQPITRLMPCDHANELPGIMERLKRGERVGRFETVRMRKDGSRADVSVMISPVRNAEGQIVGASKIARDITAVKVAANALRQSEARKAAILNVALDAIVTIDARGQVLEFNPAAEATFGYTAAEAVGRSIAELIIPPAFREQHYRGLARYLATGEGPVLNKRIELTALRADGREFPVELAITPIPTDASPVFTAHVRDITERSRRDQRRVARLAITQTLAEAASFAEAAPRILQAVCESLEWDVGALWQVDRGASLLRCIEVWHRPAVQAADFEAMTRSYTFARDRGLPGRVWTSAKPAWIPDVARDTNFPRAPVAAKEGLHGAFGCPIVLDREVLGVIEFFSHQIREPDADLLEMMATIGSQIGHFIERIRADRALRVSEQRFAKFMEHLPGLAWIKDLQGRYVYANQAAASAFRTPREQLYGKTDQDVFPPETAEQFRQNDEQAVATGVSVQVVETLEQEDGILHHSIVSKFPIPGSNGEAMLVGGMAVDITDRLRAEEALQEADRRKDEFLAMLAHELRNPLAPIRNALHVMKMPGAGQESIERARQMTERQVQQMVRLVDDLLDVSRLMQGRIELRPEPVELADVLARGIETSQPMIDARGQQLIVSVPPEPLPLEADADRLAQVFANLLHNAAKFSERPGRIWLTAQRHETEVEIRIRDEGAGIHADLLPVIFDLFVQGDRSLERSQGGLGIGLTVVRRLIELHGGRVSAHSAGLGQGSEFTIRLPVRLCAAAPQPAGESHRQMRATHARRVLVVDDNVDAAESVAMLLRLAGHNVRLAYNGPEALQVAESHHPEVVVLDIGLPGINGYQVAEQLRQRPEFQRAMLIAVTGYGQDEDRQRSKEAGFDHHLIKPVDPMVLQDLLARRVP